MKNTFQVNTKRTFLDQNCPYRVGVRSCAPERYRSYDGFCNNIENPYWGSANLRYLRFLPPAYADGKSFLTSELLLTYRNKSHPFKPLNVYNR